MSRIDGVQPTLGQQRQERRTAARQERAEHIEWLQTQPDGERKVFEYLLKNHTDSLNRRGPEGQEKASKLSAELLSQRQGPVVARPEQRGSETFPFSFSARISANFSSLTQTIGNIFSRLFGL